MKLQELLDELAPSNTRLIAVSKKKPNEMILDFYEQGQLDFGENRVQELTDKYEDLPKDIRWHFVGNLQTNKIKYIAPFVHLIQSVDRLKVLKEINKRARQNERVIDCLLQFHIAEEDTKSGFDWEEATAALESEAYANMEHVRIVGVMGMATFTDDHAKVRREFQQLKQYFDRLKAAYFPKQEYFREVSMGMTGDYKIAIEEGSTMIRIGSLLFGPRD